MKFHCRDHNSWLWDPLVRPLEHSPYLRTLSELHVILFSSLHTVCRVSSQSFSQMWCLSHACYVTYDNSDRWRTRIMFLITSAGLLWHVFNIVLFADHLTTFDKYVKFKCFAKTVHSLWWPKCEEILNLRSFRRVVSVYGQESEFCKMSVLNPLFARSLHSGVLPYLVGWT
jgi:hypothetical protein